MTLFVCVRAKSYAYLMDDNSEHRKSKGTKKCIIKRKLMVNNYENCLLNNKVILKSQQRFKSDYHEVYTIKDYFVEKYEDFLFYDEIM